MNSKQTLVLLISILLQVEVFCQLKMSNDPPQKPQVIYKTVPTSSSVSVNSQIVDYKKVGIYFVNSESVQEMMPEFKLMQAKADSKHSEYESKLNQMISDYEAKVNYVNSNSQTLHHSILEVKIQEIERLNSQIKDFKILAETEMEKYVANLREPLVEKYQNTLRGILKELGGIAIFNVANGAIPVYEKELDITEKVIKKIGAY